MALIPLLWVLWTVRGRRAAWRGFGLGWLAGTVFFCGNLSWLWTVSGLGELALGAYLGVFWGVWGAWAATFGNPWRGGGAGLDADSGGWARAARSLRFAFVNAAVWAGLEWFRGWVLTGFGWNGLGVAFHQTPVLAQAADLLGVAGLSFLPVFVQCVIVLTARRLHEEARGGRFRPHWEFAAAMALLASAFFYGVARITAEGRKPSLNLDVLVVQLDIPQDVKWAEQSAESIYRAYAEETDRALAEIERSNDEAVRKSMEEGREGAEIRWPDLVVWPESALPAPLWFHAGDGYPEGQPNAGYIEHEAIAGRGFNLAVGLNEMELQKTASGDYIRREEGGHLYNSIVLFPGSFAGASSYRKMHLVPFGEFIPLRERLPFMERLFKFSAGVDFGLNFSRGRSAEPLAMKLDGKSVGIVPAVCFEDTVGRLMRRFLRPGPQIFLNATNDGWFKQSAAAEQHLANARFRSIEFRRPMVRAANTGVSCLIDTAGSLADPEHPGKLRAILGPDGRPFVKGHLFGTLRVPGHPTPTLYAAVGDWGVILLAGLGVAVGIFPKLWHRKNTRAGGRRVGKGP
jgi:apolipoprotein N-acyltransferase